MKKKLIIISTILCLSIAIYLCFRIFIGIQEKLIAKKNTESIPKFSFVTMSGRKFGNSELPNVDGKIVFNYFSPDCDHCQYMATEYLKYKEQIKGITFLMITRADSSSVEKFSKEYLIDSLPNIIILRDDKFTFYKIFGSANVPSFFIYYHQKFVKKIIGESKMENIITSNDPKSN